MSNLDQEMMDNYERAVTSLNERGVSSLQEFSRDYSAWCDYIDTLRKGFSAGVKLNLDVDFFPDVLYDYSGLEYQIDVEPSDERVAFDESGEKTISDLVFRELMVARAKQEWNENDSFEEFSDLEDDEDEIDRTAFEKAWLNMEKDRQREFYEEFIKGQVPPKKKQPDSVKESEGSEPQGSEGHNGLPVDTGSND